MWSLWSGAKTAVLSKAQSVIDSQITHFLRPYLAMGEDSDGRQRSDVCVDAEGDILIEDCVLKPSAVDALFAENELPLHVVMAHVRRIFVDIPWFNFAKGDWKLEVEGVMIVVTPKERADWSVEDVRMVKEYLVSKGLRALVTRQQELSSKPKKPSLVTQMLKGFLARMKPILQIRDVHVRFERFDPVVERPFSCGFIMHHMSLDVTPGAKSDEAKQESSISMGHTGMYCRTVEMGANSVLPDDHVMFGDEPDFSVATEAKAKGRRAEEDQEELEKVRLLRRCFFFFCGADAHLFFFGRRGRCTSSSRGRTPSSARCSSSSTRARAGTPTSGSSVRLSSPIRATRAWR